MTCGANGADGLGAFDRTAAISGAELDFDRDGTIDDCDGDQDNDDVLDQSPDGRPLDNCPLGNGNIVWEPEDVRGPNDQNPDQTDCNCNGQGDFCEPLAVTCPPSPCDTRVGEFPRRTGSAIDFIPGLAACSGRGAAGGTCDVRAFLTCEGAEYDRCWLPDAFDQVVLVNTSGQVWRQIDFDQHGMSGGVSRNGTMVPDLDGDGLDDFAFAAPRASVCPHDETCFGAPGVVGLYSSGTGTLIDRIQGPSSDALFGAGLASNGDTIAIGAPGAGGGAGEVFLYRIGASAFSGGGAQGLPEPSFSLGQTNPPVIELRRTLRGREGDRLGSDISRGLGTGSADPSFLVGSPGARSGDGEIVLVDASRGITQRFLGPIPGAGMSRAVVAAMPAGRMLVVGALPSAYSGAGALAFWNGAASVRVRRGTAGARLGDALVALVRDGRTQIVAAAPGDGDGAIVTFDTRGSVTATTRGQGSLFGTGLASPGDLDHDGREDLVVGFALDATGADLRALPIYELAP